MYKHILMPTDGSPLSKKKQSRKVAHWQRPCARALPVSTQQSSMR